MYKKIFYLLFVVFGVINIATANESYYPSEGQIKISEVNPTENLVKLYNTGETPVDLSGWVLYDEQDAHELFITLPDLLENQDLMLASKKEITILCKNDSDFALHKEGGEVRLFSGPIEIDGILHDEVKYSDFFKINLEEDSVSEKAYETQESNSNNNSADIHYQIPENSGEAAGVKKQTDEVKNNSKPSETKGAEDHKDPDNNSGTSLNANSNTNNNSLSQDKPNTFMASTKMEKSPYSWFYRLWYNWFLWRIILPFISLWATMYFIVYFVRKKYLS